MIIGFRAKGGSISETAEFVNCSRAAVVKVYRAWQNGTVQNQRRGKCGAPRAIDDRGERRLRRCVRADRRATVEQLTTKMNQGATKSVSQSTIQRTLLRLGLRSRRLVRAPMLTAVHRRRRLEFARQYSSWTSTEWRQVAFSDESRFMLHRTDGRWRIRRETSERNHPATIAGTVQAGGGSIMVWGMFSWHSLGSLIIVEGTMDQYKYASVLADHVHPYMRIVFPQDDGIFQQDNARCHTAASVRAWFEEHQDEFTVLPWPANSPDLNPIEHLRLLQCGLRARTPLYRIPLTHDHRRLRLQWANQHRDWRADWQHVVFSDESRFNLWYHDGRIRVRRYAGERHLPECIIERHSGRTPGVMVWGAIAYHRRSQLLRIVGNLNSNRYIREVLQPEAVPFLQSLPGAVFQQDNARPHTARIVKSFFAAQQVQLLPWPACSPDMSPIEHVWDVIGRRLARDPRPVASADELWVRVQTIWNALPQSDIQTLFDSMPRRVAALIAARGGHTKY
ncbi:Transposable element Tcb1 transposase, partial [Stegodyphus mimosarum]